jgi:UDP-N-acetylmuramyl tripeptide synthase
MHLDQLIERLPGVASPAGRSTVPAAEIRGVTADPDRVGPDTVFAAIPERLAADPLGMQTALQRGAPAVICRPGTVIPRGTRRIAAEQPGRAFSDAAAALNGVPLNRLRVFRVALPGRMGTAGAVFLHTLLESTGQRTALLTAEGGLLAGRHFPQAPAEEDCNEWQRLLSAHLRSGGDTLVMEDCPAVRQVLGSGIPRQDILVTHSSGGLIQPIALHWRGSRIQVRVGNTERLAHTPVAGTGALRALDAAYSTAIAAGADPSRLAALLPALSCAAGSMEPVTAGQPFGVFVDGADDAESLRELLRESREMTSGAVILVTGASSETTPEQRRLLGEVASGADRILLTADNPRRAGFAAITADILRGTTRPAQVESDRHRAVTSAIRQARSGDVVLLAGKGHRPVQEIEGTIVPWDDRAHARDALAARGWIGDLS